MTKTIAERTAGGQEIHVYDNRFQETRVRIMWQGVEINTGLAGDYVAMPLQDAREIYAALGNALANYDAEDGIMPPAEPYDQGTINEAFLGDCALCGCNDLAGNNGDAAECGCKCHASMPDWD